ncbi:thermonuclease family protein [Amycolatopsis nigrescens]|uniref:thermonuclease family protein n=1 Tax=Amycolatopsis nigrescens TaxID=381445 RepID=UPI0004776533|nr:excalibur calcium-binding domain-containing protein [Amycolatopsis nigrescens]
MPSQESMPGKRLPKWLKITLAVFAVLFVLGAIFGRSPDDPQPVAAPVTTSATPTTTTSPSPAVVNERVTAVTDGHTVVLASGKKVRAAGIRAPIGTGCFHDEAAAWAIGQLIGQAITVQLLGVTDQAGIALASLTTANGADYAATALQAGYAKYIVDGASAAVGSSLQTAERIASTGALGLWGSPCKGNIDSPAPAPSPTAAASVPKATTKAAEPEPATEAPPARETEAPAGYYPNCAAARAAGVAPLHRGDPGYSRKLDADGDGVACERK